MTEMQKEVSRDIDVLQMKDTLSVLFFHSTVTFYQRVNTNMAQYALHEPASNIERI